MKGLFKINGFWKDDKTKFSDYLVCENAICPSGINEDEIMFFGLSELEIQEAIENKWNTDLEFVITSYQKMSIA